MMKANPGSFSGSRLKRFLFEDDHDVTRAIVNFLSSGGAVRRFVTRGLLVLSLLLLALLASIAAKQPTEHQKEIGEAVRGQSLGDPEPAFTDDLSPLVADENAASSARGYGFVPSALEDPNYIFGFTSTAARTAEAGAEGVPSSGTLTSHNNTGTQTQLAMGGGGSGGAPFGAAGTRVITGAPQAAPNVPDSGYSLGLLGFALGLLIFGQRFRIYCHRYRGGRIG